MPRIPDETIERIKDATDIVDIVSEYVQLNKRGRNFLGLCPFHTEKTPSFNVNPELQIYKCFGCNAAGNVFKFLQEHDKVSFVEAVTLLAQRSGIALPQRGRADGADDVTDEIFRANELAQKYYHHLLYQEEGRGALEYLHGRKLTDETIERFNLGYAPAGWDGLLKVAGKRGLSPAAMEKAGLALPRQKGEGHYDRFRDRATFAIANLSKRTIGFGARSLKSDQEPKYLNSPETPIYHKSSVLYGLSHTREEIRRQGTALIVEGYMDLLSLAQQGIDHVVASAGTAFTEEQCRALARYAGQVVLVFDGDAAGSTAAQRGLEVLLGAGVDARVVSLPGEHDPDTFVQAEGADGLLAAVEGAQAALDFYLAQLGGRFDLDTLQGKAQAAEALKPLLGRCQDAVRRDLMLREAAQRLGVDERALRQEFQRDLGRRRAPERTQETAAPRSAGPPLREKEFLALLLQHPQYIAPAAAELTPEIFGDARSRQVAQLLFGKYREATQLDPALLVNEIDDGEVAALIGDCALQGLDENQVEQQYRDGVAHFSSDALTRRIDQTKQALQEAVAAKDEEKINAVNAELMHLVRQRQQLETA